MANFKKILGVFSVLIFLLSCNVGLAKELEPQVHTVNYVSDLQADLVRISDKKGVPAVILIHGGSWCRGSRKDLSDFAVKLAKNGYFVMNIDYHLLPKYSQSTQTKDVTSAIWWLRENSSSLGVNPSKLGLVGVSAGGYLTAWASTHDEVDSLGTHSRPNAAVSISGPWDLSKESEKEALPDAIKLINAFCAEEDHKWASPQYYISASAPPTLIIHGDADKLVPVSQAVNAYHQLKLEHCNCKISIKHNDGHISPNTPSYFQAMNKSVKFLNRVLK